MVRDKKIANKYPDLDPRYIFINSGFNLRPTDIQGNWDKSISKLENLKTRVDNRNRIIKSLKSNPKWNNQFYFIKVPKNFT